jgi:hypothetical protein
MTDQFPPTPDNPAPLQPSAGGQPAPPHSVRGRVLRHLRRLLPKTVIAGAALHLSGCDVTGPPIVCDPLPPPVDCSAELTTEYLSQWAWWQARWVQREDGLAIEIFVDLSRQNLHFTAEPGLEGATAVDLTTGETSLTIICTPAVSATAVNVTVPVTCDSTDATLRLVLDISGTPTADTTIPIASGA